MTSPATRQPAPPYLTVFATLVIVLTIAAMIHDRRRVRTGELRIQADAEEFRVAIRKDGRIVIPATAQRAFVLPPGDYQVVLESPGQGLRVEPDRLHIVPGKRSVTRIEFQPPRR